MCVGGGNDGGRGRKVIGRKGREEAGEEREGRRREGKGSMR